ncbi:hypothetical protein [Paraglaciecola agarilytica]|uniref:hypothetical protein n=1 Tax=Paraglaciecola chathamensis TaxID=368405 RepID=UPI002355969B|nr:hypothetical protein [Paraglaciecola agarilytica]
MHPIATRNTIIQLWELLQLTPGLSIQLIAERTIGGSFIARQAGTPRHLSWAGLHVISQFKLAKQNPLAHPTWLHFC